jgi:predicted nucleic acid-binding protein
MKYFWDSSTLVKRYVEETGSEWVYSTFLNAEHIVIISNLTIVEVMAALQKKHRMSEITNKEQEAVR